ncbi:MAG: ATP-binding response regulator [Thermodesulfobacteriota bacterium]
MQTRKLKTIWLVGFFAWTLIIVALWFYEDGAEKDFIQRMALSEARGSYNKDLVYRRWAAKQGGVYVEKSSHTPPNPYLAHIPTRDVVTSEGVELTLVNPAYMTRQVHELALQQYGAKGHITSLTPLRPENAPDPWEKAALQDFHDGAEEATTRELIDGELYQRLMMPMITEEMCLKCHAHQGYKVGEIRGGISVSVPLEPYRQAYLGSNYQSSVTLFLIWMLGAFFAAYTYRVIRRQLVNESAARKAAQTSETKYRAFFNELNVGLVVADAQSGEIIECNDRMAAMIERPVTEILGQHQSILHCSEHKPDSFNDTFIQHRDNKPGEVLKDQLQGASGAIIDVEIKGQKFTLYGRELMIGMFHDVRDKKEAEEQRRELEKQLNQKHKMEAIGHMAGGMAHNFNNHLAIILGNIELTQLKSKSSEKIQPYLANAKQAVLRSRDLIKQIMIYTRTEDAEYDAVSAVEVLEETAKLLSSTIPTSVDFKQVISPEIGHPIIWGDFTRIQEALINLCTNAVDAMDEKGKLSINLDRVHLTPGDLQVYPDALPGFYICFAVTDSGCGLSPEIEDKIFDPFFTTKEVGKGSGMGLATVRGIVDSHHGFITVNSSMGEGSVIKLYFPEGKGKHNTAREENSEEIPRGRGRVLLIDDEEMVLATNHRILEELGYSVTSQISSTNALQLIQQDPQRYDLIITDQTMPELTGMELSERVRKTCPDVPIILCTGFSSKVSKKDAEKIGISAFCFKPLERAELARVANDCLDKTQ